jgi:hypothetical protein
MRAAVEDLNSKAIGSASQFLEVPQVGRGRLALSGVLLKGDTESEGPQIHVEPNSDSTDGLVDGVLRETRVRVLSRGDRAFYAYEIYDGLKDDYPDLQMATSVIRDGRIVYQRPVHTGHGQPEDWRQDPCDSHWRHAVARTATCQRAPTRSRSSSRTEYQEARTTASGSTSRFAPDRMRVSSAAFLGVLTSRQSLPAQQPPQVPPPLDAPSFRASTDLVTIDAVVTTSDGSPSPT